MTYLISLVHASACILIVLFILLQHPKGGGILGVLGGGGGGKSLFSAGGASDFLVNTTKWLTVIFALTSLSLSYISAQKDSSLMADPALEAERPALEETADPASPKGPSTKGEGGESEGQAPADLSEKSTQGEEPSSAPEQTTPSRQPLKAP